MTPSHAGRPNTTDSRRADAPLRTLWAASLLGGLGQSLAGSAGALLAEQIAGSDVAAGLPQTLLVLGSAISALVLSRMTIRRGRGVALSAGAATAALGSVLVVVAAWAASLPAVLVGSLLLGAGNTAVMLGRYAAADLAPESSRARAMASVLVATTVGAVAGPNLLAPTSALAAATGLPGLAGPYVVAAAAFVAAAGVLRAGWRPSRDASGTAYELENPPPNISSPTWSSRAVAGLAVLGTANLVMVGVMTMAPVQLHQAGTGLGVIGLVISLHIAGMFAPSPISGRLTDRMGAARAAALAATILVIACSGAAEAHSAATMTVAMVLLGVGWNLSLLSGSALLTGDVAPRQRPIREGWGESGMGVAAAGGGVASGVVMAGGGYSMLAAMGAAIACIVFPLAWVGRSGFAVGEQRAEPASSCVEPP
ncbi:MAG: MFS transporter [Pseudonocardiales bacterium]|nr:MAG: MFS transporter [Pseudonocardiales bacterium]